MYIKKYLPVLAKMPTKYIYEPWKARSDQSKFVCMCASCMHPHPPPMDGPQIPSFLSNHPSK